MRGRCLGVEQSAFRQPPTSLIPNDRLPAPRPEVCQQLHASEDGAIRLAQRGRELAEVFPQVDRLITRHATVPMEKGRVVVAPLEASDQSS
jgi:hypothetical protein